LSNSRKECEQLILEKTRITQNLSQLPAPRKNVPKMIIVDIKSAVKGQRLELISPLLICQSEQHNQTQIYFDLTVYF
jgi:hypothetical protein